MITPLVAWSKDDQMLRNLLKMLPNLDHNMF